MNHPPPQAEDRAIDLVAQPSECPAPPGGPVWSPESCDGSKTVDLSASSFTLRCYCLESSPSTRSPGTLGCYCGKGRSPRWTGSSADTSLRSFGMEGARSPGLPNDCKPMPPPAWAKGWEVRTHPAPTSEVPVQQSTYRSPPMLLAQRRSSQEPSTTWAVAQPPP